MRPTYLILAPLATTSAWPSSSSSSSSSPPGKNAILLSNVQQLVLHGHGAVTTHRRVPAAPQLSCLSSPAICRLADDSIDVMRCTNAGRGYSPEDIQWECTAALPSTLRLTSTQVVCEGYRSAHDDHVLQGSCGVEYRLGLTDEGLKRYPAIAGESADRPAQTSAVRFLVTLVVAFAAFYYVCRFLGGGGGGGGQQQRPGANNGFNPPRGRRDSSTPPRDPPPPPYTADYYGSSSSPSATDTHGQSSSASTPRSGAGFSAGAAAGAAAAGAAGYAAGRASTMWRNAPADSRGGSSWFGANRAGYRAPASSTGSSSPEPGSSRSSSSSTTTTIQSTGYGGTSRR